MADLAQAFHGFEKTLSGKRVLVTGHTGFTGAWLSHWLCEIGADVHGIALSPEGDRSLFNLLDLADRVGHNIIDIRDASATTRRIIEIDAEVVVHLAAQPLVLKAYSDPLDTFATNVMGTANVLEGCRLAKSTRAVVVITTDKVYENREWPWPYRENDRLGGKDPYSASKSAAEMIVTSYQQTLFRQASHSPDQSLAVAVARGGNIVGGGDWAANRLVPDFARAAASGTGMTIRNPDAVRPWQHVIALCHGYLAIAARLLGDDASDYSTAWNLGPDAGATRTVKEVITTLCDLWRDPGIRYFPSSFAEAQLLTLDSSKARVGLDWRPPWGLAETLERTVDWYRTLHESPADIVELTKRQLSDYRLAIATV